MSRHIIIAVCFVIVLMTSHDVTGQAHDVAQLNRKLTAIKSSVASDIFDIRLEIRELKMIVEQMGVGQKNASDGFIIGQGMTGVDQKEIADLKTKLTTHENRLKTLFNTVNEIQLENSALLNKVNQLVEKQENDVKTELLKLNTEIETKFNDKVNALQKKFEETVALMIKGYKNQKTHMSDQMNNLSMSVISEQNKMSTRMDQADAKVVKLNGEVNMLETHMSVQMKNMSHAMISGQNKLSARIDKADGNIARLDGGANKLDVFSRAIAEMKTKTDKCCIDCGDPTPDHGTVNTTATTYGTVLKISCNHGYVLSGTNIIKCNADSVWSESVTCNPYDCGSAAPTNGHAIAPSGTTFQNQATVQCNPGYTLNGSSVIQCNSTGWNDSVSCVNIDECASKPCQNGGACADLVNGFTCKCAAGFNGYSCQTNIDECASKPCQNGGACADLVNGYTCTCEAGFNGNNCETNINECATNPCKNGAACIDGINAYSCKCVTGWTGTNCDNIDECASKPCQNGGACADLVNGYTCKCWAGFNGNNCETRQQPMSSNGYRVKPIFGIDLWEHIKLGTRVVRGRDWDADERDGGGPGTVSHVYTEASTVWVKWDKRRYQDGYYYYNGYKGKYHLLILADEQ